MRTRVAGMPLRGFMKKHVMRRLFTAISLAGGGLACWGILLRFLLMPIACHYDLLSYYFFAHEVVFHERTPLEGQLIGQLYLFLPTAHLNMAWLWLIKPLLGSGDLWAHNWFPGGDVHQINNAAWQAFVSAPNIGLVLFLFKLPTLFCEWGIIRMLCSMKADPIERKRMSLFLWFNPISLFVFYIYGSMEIFVLLLLTASIFYAAQKRTVLAAVLLGCSAPFRLFPMWFAPTFALVFGRRITERLRFAGWVCLPFVSWLAAIALSLPGALAFMAKYPSINFTLSLRLPLQAQDSLYPFVIGYVIVLCVYTARRGLPLTRLIDAILVTLLLFYATCFFHPQYFVWYIPWLALRVASYPGLLWPFLIQVLCFTVYIAHWGRPLAGFLFAPLNPEFFMGLPSPLEAMSSIVPPEKIVGLAHSVLAGASLWMAYLVLAPRTRDSGT